MDQPTPLFALSNDDPRAWARRILDREAAGDATLPYIARVFAREALKLPPPPNSKAPE